MIKLLAISMLEAGQSQSTIDRYFDKSKSTISRLEARYRQTADAKARAGKRTRNNVSRIDSCGPSH